MIPPVPPLSNSNNALNLRDGKVIKNNLIFKKQKCFVCIKIIIHLIIYLGWKI